uniref:Spliceosome-associated protein CWC27 homolog n=1 Tax=Nilaparvata lugens TaxID=108931 RepID=A0A1I9WLJ3_NILLU|nr:seminal fluid protein [Nilaparvata lugens]
MSNIYVQEPPTNGKVLLKTSVGDLDIELWSKEAPKACRNFVQLCMENYYNGTIFHRIVKGFIAQGGDPTGTGTGGESIYGEPFKDEIHSRLRFNRRGLVAMANAGKDDNGSQFFFTFAAANELQGKHTIFGKISGETIYNMLKLEDALVDHDDRPQYPQKIISAEILSNPFDDIVPRTKKRDEDSENQNASEEGKKKKKAGVKNYKLLSFGEEAEEDEEESVVASKAFAGKSKSTHDLLDDPKLSAMPAVDKEQSSASDQDSDSDQSRQKTVENVRSKLKKSSNKSRIPEPEPDKVVDDEEEFEEYDFHKEKREERKRKAEEIRKEISDLKKDFKKSKQKKEEEVVRQEKKDAATDSTIEKYKNELAAYQEKKKQLPLKGVSREEFTLSLLNKFVKKLHSAKEKTEEPDEEKSKEKDSAADDDVEAGGSNWMAHKLQFEDNDPLVAKDANTKGDDWFDIYDPRHALNKRRREESKKLMASRK